MSTLLTLNYAHNFQYNFSGVNIQHYPQGKYIGRGIIVNPGYRIEYTRINADNEPVDWRVSVDTGDQSNGGTS